MNNTPLRNGKEGGAFRSAHFNDTVKPETPTANGQAKKTEHSLTMLEIRVRYMNTPPKKRPCS